jgi:macrodomain Ter protein organizer (MatP/YcbG family)
MNTSNPTISLDIDQYQHLQEIAQRKGHSLNETLHEVIHLGIDALQYRKQQRLNALKQLTQIRQDIAQNQGKYPNEILEIIREERMQQIDPFNHIAP